MSQTQENMNIPEEYQDLVNNASLESLALVIVDLLEMTKGQIENNLVTAALLNSFGEILVDKNITTQEEFEPILQKHMKNSEDIFNQGVEELYNKDQSNEKDEPSE